jgi:hypothetical protein
LGGAYDCFKFFGRVSFPHHRTVSIEGGNMSFACILWCKSGGVPVCPAPAEYFSNLEQKFLGRILRVKLKCRNCGRTEVVMCPGKEFSYNNIMYRTVDDGERYLDFKQVKYKR